MRKRTLFTVDNCERLMIGIMIVICSAIFVGGFFRDENVKSRGSAGTYSIAPQVPAKCVKVGNCYSCHMVNAEGR